ncbi:RNA polymerase sigma-70 factor [Bacteroides sp.]
MNLLNKKNRYNIPHYEDSKTFEAFFLHYYPQVKNFINRLIQNDEDSEDLSQDIFTNLWQNRKSLNEVENLNAYLYRMAKNAVYRYIKRNLLFKNYQEKQSASDSLLQLTFNQTEEDLQAHELELLVALAVDKMPHQRQKIYKMSREQGINNEQIALELNISKRTVENHLTQALADIRKLLLMITFTFF